MKTPETLRQAIQNGIEDMVHQLSATTRPAPKASDIIERHVLDFLRSHYSGLCLAIETRPITTQTAIECVRIFAHKIGIERR